MIEKLTGWLSKIAGPNAAHVIDAMVAWELTAAGAALKSQSVRDYGVHHPGVAVAITVVPPVLTAVAAKFRKAASKPPTPKQ